MIDEDFIKEIMGESYYQKPLSDEEFMELLRSGEELQTIDISGLEELSDNLEKLISDIDINTFYDRYDPSKADGSFYNSIKGLDTSEFDETESVTEEGKSTELAIESIESFVDRIEGIINKLKGLLNDHGSKLQNQQFNLKREKLNNGYSLKGTIIADIVIRDIKTKCNYKINFATSPDLASFYHYLNDGPDFYFFYENNVIEHSNLMFQDIMDNLIIGIHYNTDDKFLAYTIGNISLCEIDKTVNCKHTYKFNLNINTFEKDLYLLVSFDDLIEIDSRLVNNDPVPLFLKTF